MRKRHRKRRVGTPPRYHGGGDAIANNAQPSQTVALPQSTHDTATTGSADPGHQTNSVRQDCGPHSRRDEEKALEDQRVRFFGGDAGDDSLLEPMLKVVTELFDGKTDYEDP
ncbi:hypothetical protein BU23DRAFT_568292 [Bimuria novae-zelandiae CBS 107.79]|uniref:Uncharacterized protein n=1 Tax=Bimuria novae-zelandiae CBS 107.79 TaxID=1447943 RepID=A0A6A5V827_9PLEO|nr:hypothetical protein BU23DRAFT_568292 [Bimuria novae-zelandiae CBS 107.79]